MNKDDTGGKDDKVKHVDNSLWDQDKDSIKKRNNKEEQKNKESADQAEGGLDNLQNAESKDEDSNSSDSSVHIVQPAMEYENKSEEKVRSKIIMNICRNQTVLNQMLK